MDAQSQNTINALPKPNANQLAFLDLEMGLFIHYGMITYTRYERTGREHPNEFAPTALDCENWMRAAAAMGAKFVVLTVRHQEGFCLWPTKTTDFSVAGSSYMGGNGDIVREFVNACRRNGLKPCFYICPYMDAHHLFEEGDPFEWHVEWFNTTKKRFADPTTARRFTDIQRRQIHELLTEYGDIAYLWLDHITETQGILDPDAVDAFWDEIMEEARACQPECLLMKVDIYLSRDSEAKGGVHGGRAAYPLWHACKRVDTREGRQDPIPDKANGDQFILWESNTIFSGDWFWNGEHIKPVDEMMEHYYATIGRGSTFLPNFAPAPDGLMTAATLRAAAEFGDRVRRIYAEPIAMVENVVSEARLELSGKPFTHLEIMEDLTEGQKISSYIIEILRSNHWEILTSGSSVAHKRLHKFEPTTADAIRFICTEYLVERPFIRRFAAYS